MTLGERLVELRIRKGFKTRKEFAAALGIPETTLRNYEKNERDPGHKFLKEVSNKFNVSVDYLLCQTDDFEILKPIRLVEEEQDMIEKYRTLDDHGKRIVDYVLTEEYDRCQKASPVTRVYTYYRHIACAGDGFVFDDIPAETIEANECPGADFIIGVNGDSMEPTFFDGDLVYVRRVDDVRIGAIGIFTVNNECFIKERGEECLISHNPNYPNIPGTKDIRCIGEVLGKVAT